jgi:hypothetical protein
VTQGSFDAYIWQALETKAKFIAQVLTGDSTVRQAEDIGAQELSYAEVKAIARQPAVLTSPRRMPRCTGCMSSRSTMPTSSSWPGASCAPCGHHPAGAPCPRSQDMATAEAHATDP